MSSWEVIVGDSLDVLAQLAPESVDAIVCDPPYGLEFMGREWDRFREDDQGVPGYNGRAAGELGEIAERDGETLGGRLRVGVGGGKRPSTSRCEGCGKRDQFRKPHGCPDGTNWRTELIDPHAAPPSMLAFQSWCREWARLAYRVLKPGGHLLAFGGTRTSHRLVCGIEDAGFEVRDTIAWLYGSGFPKSLNVGGGWGTALKPAHEPIVVARKPLAGNVAQTVLEHGTGALNVDGCRIGTDVVENGRAGRGPHAMGSLEGGPMDFAPRSEAFGRWPANVVLDPEAAAMLDAQAPDTGGGGFPGAKGGIGQGAVYGAPGSGNGLRDTGRVDANGGASRFFYCAKASTAERNALDLSYLPRARSRRKRAQQDSADRWRPRARNRHPTVKPVELMRWLVRLVTPVGGLVVDPFAGSGTTGCAAVLEGFRFVGIEREHGSAIIARARIAWWAQHPDGVELVRRLEVEAAREAVAAAGQLDLFAPTPNVESAA